MRRFIKFLERCGEMVAVLPTLVDASTKPGTPWGRTRSLDGHVEALKWVCSLGGGAGHDVGWAGEVVFEGVVTSIFRHVILEASLTEDARAVFDHLRAGRTEESAFRRVCFEPLVEQAGIWERDEDTDRHDGHAGDQENPAQSTILLYGSEFRFQNSIVWSTCDPRDLGEARETDVRFCQW